MVFLLLQVAAHQVAQQGRLAAAGRPGEQKGGVRRLLRRGHLPQRPAQGGAVQVAGGQIFDPHQVGQCAPGVVVHAVAQRPGGHLLPPQLPGHLAGVQQLSQLLAGVGRGRGQDDGRRLRVIQRHPAAAAQVVDGAPAHLVTLQQEMTVVVVQRLPFDVGVKEGKEFLHPPLGPAHDHRRQFEGQVQIVLHLSPLRREMSKLRWLGALEQLHPGRVLVQG